MKKIILAFTCFFILLSISPLELKCKELIGWIEMIKIYPGSLKIRAKMDTGAKSSSINIHNMQNFKREGEHWVKFDIKERKKKGEGKKVSMEKKIIRFVILKRKGGGFEKRPVINMEICIGGIYKKIQMSLVDRSNFNYQILIGRIDLKKEFIIDPSAIFTHKPNCKIPAGLKHNSKIIKKKSPNKTTSPVL